MIAWILGCKISLYSVFGQSYMFDFMLLISSSVLKFCLWHKILIFSMTFVLFLEDLQRFGVEFNYYSYICIIIVLFSIVLSSILYYKHGCYCKKDHNKIV